MVCAFFCEKAQATIFASLLVAKSNQFGEAGIIYF
jgi:hypothetical protein